MSTFYERAKEILDKHEQNREAALAYVKKHRTAAANAEHMDEAADLGWAEQFRKVHADTRTSGGNTGSEKFVSGTVTGSVHRRPKHPVVSPAREKIIREAALKAEEEFFANYRLQWINIALKDATSSDIRTVRDRYAGVRTTADNHIKWFDEVLALFPKGDLTSTLPSQFYKRVHELHVKYVDEGDV